MEKLNVPSYVKAAIYGIASTLATEDDDKELAAKLSQACLKSWNMHDSEKMAAFIDMIENYDK